MAIPEAVTASALGAVRSRRRMVEQALEATCWLDDGDRALLQAVLEQGVPVARLARAAGVPTRRLTRRVQRLVRRLADPIVPFVMQHHRDWPPARRRVAETVILRGLSLRTAASRLEMSLHRVRREMSDVRLLHEMVRGAGCGVRRESCGV
ncbi:MAG: hypothetical protein ACYTGG_10620, partial [Planctomycetota bacterium]